MGKVRCESCGYKHDEEIVKDAEVTITRDGEQEHLGGLPLCKVCYNKITTIPKLLELYEE